jgi:hypothetical protein
MTKEGRISMVMTLGRPALVCAATVVVITLGLTGVATDAPRANAASAVTGQRSSLVVAVNWPAGNGSPGAPADKTMLDLLIQFEAVNDWYASVSHSQFFGWEADGAGPFTIEPPRMGEGVCTAFPYDLRAKANRAARVAGFEPDDYAAVVYYFSFVPQCPWAGLSDGRNVWINGANALFSAALQELGHTLGLGHGLALRCVDAAGVRVALSGDCTTVPYGDPHNVMGNGTGSFSAIQQYQVGWLTDRMLDVPPGGGTFWLDPIELAWGTHALRMVDGAATLWLEYRQPIGVDSSLHPSHAGVLIRQQVPGQGLKSFLLDMTPASNGGYVDARLPAGVTWINPLGTMKITVVWAGSNGAWVAIEPALPAVPDVRGYPVTTARQVLAAAGFGVGTQYSTVDCNNIGLVVSHSPAPGTRAPMGSSVNLRIGARPAPPRSCP